MVAGGRTLGREIVELLQAEFCDPQKLNEWSENGHAAALLLAAKENNNRLVNQLLSHLGVSHTKRFSADEIDYYHLLDTYASAGLRSPLKELFPAGVVQYVGIGVLVFEQGNRFFASFVVPNEAAAECEILPGDELVSANGLPYKPIASFRGLGGRTVSLQFRREANGSITECQVRPTILRPAKMLAAASSASARVVPVRSKAIGYYKPWSLAGDRYWKLLVTTLLGPLQSCEALVLDLRGSIGGASPDFAEFFIGRSPELNLSGASKLKRTINPHWRKRTIVLVDGTTRSGNEILAFALQRAGVLTVGSKTSGEVAAAKPFLLCDRSLLLIATHRVTVDGNILEGIGVKPDVEIHRQTAYSAGKDEQLSVALGLAAE
ncbi:S41 family peptidase [Bradyrhizobium sp. STM 3843]|uniref:S41 family peptidase n=1 Tax=Bradyrhizobium sp. STM 3843 TaxID=551947 RepID=UPI0002D34E10|nr:S41 family peptidase [Bradyrhizobium sp. STM 3843]